MKIYFIVYDILPISHPHWFPPDLSPLFQEWLTTISKFSNSLICISATVAKEVKGWLDNHYSSINNLPEVKSFRLGADIRSSVPSYGLPESAGKVLSILKSKPSFLMVGTLEPRKGHAQVLSAFELLWQEGLELNLVIVGKQGWMVDQLVDKLNDHPQMDRSLFWLKEITDEYLEQVYTHGTALIVASEGEGFGLPLIEAAQHRLPAIARDLPVFRELAGENIFYFSAEEPGDLSKAIKTWLSQKDKQNIPNSSNIKYLTWEESTKELIKIIFE
jgi:glycosyltransferase involved in cell wall biosynthesis